MSVHYITCTIKEDVLADVLVVFLGRDQYLGRLNSAYITLVPKREGATDFRPISIVHSFAKVMALRLASRMVDLVGCNQSASIRGRCIHDNFILVHQSARLLHRRKVPALLLKLDVAWPMLSMASRGLSSSASCSSAALVPCGFAGSSCFYGRRTRMSLLKAARARPSSTVEVYGRETRLSPCCLFSSWMFSTPCSERVSGLLF
jgi:hypothetical protein